MVCSFLFCFFGGGVWVFCLFVYLRQGLYLALAVVELTEIPPAFAGIKGAYHYTLLTHF